MESTVVGAPPAQLCRRCREREATYKIRAERACGQCYYRYVNTKAIKRLEVLDKERRDSEGAKKYLVGLSFGPSSSSLVHIMDENTESQLKKRRAAAYEPVVVHVDTDLSPSTPEPSEAAGVLNRYREKYPRFHFECVDLSAIFDVDTIDWSSLPPVASDLDQRERLRDFFDRLPSTSSRADILRLFIRHILIATALKHSCMALLFGSTTTALAEVTLAQTAKGRGFSLSWDINDGKIPVTHYPAPSRPPEKPESPRGSSDLLVYYPMREVFRKEVITYLGLMTPPLTELIPESTKKPSSVVSHKDTSIEEVMTRFFEEVEGNYPSIVANVVRTTAKLDRHETGEYCRLCGTVLDEQGDERWKGEIGDDDEDAEPRHGLCHGCQRSLHA